MLVNFAYCRSWKFMNNNINYELHCVNYTVPLVNAPVIVALKVDSIIPSVGVDTDCPVIR